MRITIRNGEASAELGTKHRPKKRKAKGASASDQYKLVLMSFPNPDFGETNAPAPTVTVYGSTFKVLSVLTETYINKYQLGGGNFHSEILKNGKPFGYVSFNGRVWYGNPRGSAAIVYDPSEPPEARVNRPDR